MTSVVMTYDSYSITVVIKTRVRLLHVNSKTIVRFLRVLRVESGSLSPNTILRDIYDWRIKRSLALLYMYTLNHFKYVKPVATAICD